MNNRHKLLLFDIDGTLVIYKDRFPRRLFEEMVKEFFTVTISLDTYRFSGKTDKAIIADVFAIGGIPKEQYEAQEPAIMEWIAGKVEKETTPDSFHLLPNVTELLSILKKNTDTTLALLTGNLPRCAEIKLQHFDLMRYFEFGSYGANSIYRNDLGPVALEMFANIKNGNSPKEFDPIVIGDTIADVLCAKHISARSIITLTGRSTRAEVEPHKPDYLFNDLSDTEKVLEAIYH